MRFRLARNSREPNSFQPSAIRRRGGTRGGMDETDSGRGGYGSGALSVVNERFDAAFGRVAALGIRSASMGEKKGVRKILRWLKKHPDTFFRISFCRPYRAVPHECATRDLG